MGWFTALTSTAKATENVTEIAKAGVEGGISILDKAFYTSQEQTQDSIQAAGKIMDTHLALVKATASENSMRSITRRSLAIMFCVPYVLAYMIAVVFPKMADHIIKVSSTMGMGKIVLAVVIFYFGYYGLKSCIAKFKGGD